jgi:hypothetical protein
MENLGVQTSSVIEKDIGNMHFMFRIKQTIGIDAMQCNAMHSDNFWEHDRP